MKEELLKQLIPIAEKTKEGLLKAIDIAQEQCPLLIQEVLKWNFTISIVWCMFGAIVFVSSIIGLIKSYKYLDNQLEIGTSGIDKGDQFFSLFFLIPIVCGIGVMLSNYEWLQILIAPKLFLLEYIGNLIK